jgi:hypothetical protein
MKKTINIVKTSDKTRDHLVPYAHSLYVKSWKAKDTDDRHEFNTELSDNIFDAIPVSFQDFKKYFEPRNCVMLTVEITAKII